MEKQFTIKHWVGNQFIIEDFGYSFYDTELLVYTTALVDSVKKELGIIIPLNENVRVKAAFYKGKKVLGNTICPSGARIYDPWNMGKFTIETQDAHTCPTVHQGYTKDEVITLVKSMADFVNNNDVLSNSFYKKITYYDMSIICNAYSVALENIRFYKVFVDIKEGVNDFLKIANPRYVIAKDKLSKELFEELSSYGLIK